MNTTFLAWSSISLFGLLLTGSCAAPGPGYEDIVATGLPVPNDTVRIVFLRPKDADDDSNGGAASIEVNQDRAGALPYGGFFYVDTAPGPTALTAFGRYRALGVCEIDVATTPGSTVFVDVSPRLSYMIAGAVGGTIGAATGAVAATDVYGSAVAAIAGVTAGTIAGDAAGTTAAVAAEAAGRRCRGPYQLVIIAEDDALPRLSDLTWSKD